MNGCRTVHYLSNNKMKKILILLLWLPMVGVGQQQQISTLTVITTGHQPPVKAFLLHASKAIITGDTIRMSDTVYDNPVPLALFISYKGTENATNWYELYPQPGDINVTIDKDDYVKVAGPKLSEDFSNLLREPVDRYNQQISDLETQKKQSGQDTVDLRAKLNSVIHACFGVPRSYVKQYPGSPLDIIALTMMGTGDPTIEKPAGELIELFHQLTPENQNSKEGKACWARLEKLKDN